MEHQPHLLKLRHHILAPKTTKGLPMLQLAHTLDLLLKPVDHLPQQHQFKLLILVPEITKLFLTLLIVLTQDQPHKLKDH